MRRPALLLSAAAAAVALAAGAGAPLAAAPTAGQAVPRVKGMTIDKARAKLRAAGYKPSPTVWWHVWPAPAYGIAEHTWPFEGAQLAKGKRVFIVASTGLRAVPGLPSFRTPAKGIYCSVDTAGELGKGLTCWRTSDGYIVFLYAFPDNDAAPKGKRLAGARKTPRGTFKVLPNDTSWKRHGIACHIATDHVLCEYDDNGRGFLLPLTGKPETF